MADHPLPTAESIASQPKPKPRAPPAAPRRSPSIPAPSPRPGRTLRSPGRWRRQRWTHAVGSGVPHDLSFELGGPGGVAEATQHPAIAQVIDVVPAALRQQRPRHAHRASPASLGNLGARANMAGAVRDSRRGLMLTRSAGSRPPASSAQPAVASATRRPYSTVKRAYAA